jgi:glutamate-5-semialdehyde dehydrogenase
VTVRDLSELGERVRAAARVLGTSSDAQRCDALRAAAARLRDQASVVLTANASDIERARSDGATTTAIDRLTLSDQRLEAMAQGLETVAMLSNPLGERVDSKTLANGLRVERVRVPLGVVGIIYENRPNVTSDAAALCLRAANAAFLRGSSGALASNQAIVSALRFGLAQAGLPEDAISLVEDVSHETAVHFMQLNGVIDCLIPRGGPSLIASMRENATVPYVLDGDGICHVYVDAAANLDMAERIVINAKVQRPGVCNAMESLVLHADIAQELLERLNISMPEVSLLGDERAVALLPSLHAAAEGDFDREFLDLIASVKIVDGLPEAIAFINEHGSGHSEAIVTDDGVAAEIFLAHVDAAAVLHNASTRFVDGGELGLGAEVGISTQKLHARGPMGLEALTSVRWVIRGEGQVRS